MRALITGATGLVGRALVEHLDRPIVLSRSAERARDRLGDVRVFDWEPSSGPAPEEACRDVDVVFNLAGEPVAEGRWTDEKKARISSSRVDTTRNLIAGFRRAGRRPPVIVSASAIGYYGDRGDEALDETSAPGDDFLAGVCEAWEREAIEAEAIGARVVRVRIGIVLAAGGGALARMLTPFKWGVGGRIGSGRQWMSWIHIEDLVGILLHAARAADTSIPGVLNAVAPEPVTNADFTQALGNALHRPTVLPVPRAALRLAFGELSEVLVASQRVMPTATMASGYAFRHPELAEALDSVLP